LHYLINTRIHFNPIVCSFCSPLLNIDYNIIRGIGVSESLCCLLNAIICTFDDLGYWIFAIHPIEIRGALLSWPFFRLFCVDIESTAFYKRNNRVFQFHLCCFGIGCQCLTSISTLRIRGLALLLLKRIFNRQHLAQAQLALPSAIIPKSTSNNLPTYR